jgi:hypothetical protein
LYWAKKPVNKNTFIYTILSNSLCIAKEWSQRKQAGENRQKMSYWAIAAASYGRSNFPPGGFVNIVPVLSFCRLSINS